MIGQIVIIAGGIKVQIMGEYLNGATHPRTLYIVKELSNPDPERGCKAMRIEVGDILRFL